MSRISPANEETLLKAESEHNLILGLADRLNRGLGGSEDACFFPSRGIPNLWARQFKWVDPAARDFQDGSRHQHRLLVEFLIEQNIPLKGVTGPIESCQDSQIPGRNLPAELHSS